MHCIVRRIYWAWGHSKNISRQKIFVTPSILRLQICGKPSFSGFISHKETGCGENNHHHSSSSPATIHQCSMCQYSSKKSSNLTAHVKAKHPNGQGCRCDICGTGFKSEEKLNQHKGNIHQIGLDCNVCNTTFKNYKIKKQHMKKYHTVPVPSTSVPSYPRTSTPIPDAARETGTRDESLSAHINVCDSMHHSDSQTACAAGECPSSGKTSE